MASPEWFRRTTWTAQDAADFQARLKRSRSSKAQYLRIQAIHLAEAGEREAALTLLDQLFRDHPEPFELESSYLQRAQSLAALGRDEEAIIAFLDCIAAQRELTHAKTDGAVAFAWFVAQRRIAYLYEEAIALIDEDEKSDGDWLPVQRYKRAVIRALIAHERNDNSTARIFAGLAAKAAAETHSGLRYHPTLGLVPGTVDASIQARLTAIGGV